MVMAPPLHASTAVDSFEGGIELQMMDVEQGRSVLESSSHDETSGDEEVVPTIDVDDVSEGDQLVGQEEALHVEFGMPKLRVLLLTMTLFQLIGVVLVPLLLKQELGLTQEQGVEVVQYSIAATVPLVVVVLFAYFRFRSSAELSQIEVCYYVLLVSFALLAAPAALYGYEAMERSAGFQGQFYVVALSVMKVAIQRTGLKSYMDVIVVYLCLVATIGLALSSMKWNRRCESWKVGSETLCCLRFVSRGQRSCSHVVPLSYQKLTEVSPKIVLAMAITGQWSFISQPHVVIDNFVLPNALAEEW